MAHQEGAGCPATAIPCCIKGGHVHDCFFLLELPNSIGSGTASQHLKHRAISKKATRIQRQRPFAALKALTTAKGQAEEDRKSKPKCTKRKQIHDGLQPKKKEAQRAISLTVLHLGHVRTGQAETRGIDPARGGAASAATSTSPRTIRARCATPSRERTSSASTARMSASSDV